MNVVFPVPYLDRIEPGGGLCIRFDDPIERDVPEISANEAPIVMAARSSFRRRDNGIGWHSIHLRSHDGHILRNAHHSGFTDGRIAAENMPVRVGRRIDWKTGQFTVLLPSAREMLLTEAVLDMSRAKSSVTRVRRALDDEFLVEWGSERMRDLTQRALDRLVIVDGQVWKRTNWPRVRIDVDFGGPIATLSFDEDRDLVKPHYGYLPDGNHMLLSQYQRFSELSEASGDGLLPREYQVVVDHIDVEAMPLLNERLYEAWRIAATLERRVSAILGGQLAAVVTNWLALRELIVNRSSDVDVEEIVDSVVTVKNALGDDLAEIADETDHMLRIFDISDHAEPARPRHGHGLR
jgi:hypothetical protein